MSAILEQRKLISQLMSSAATSHGLTSPSTCKSFIIGHCPYDLFQETKQPMGHCPRMHSVSHKMQYERDVKKGKKYPEFDLEHYSILKKILSDCDVQIEMAHKKLQHHEEHSKLAALLQAVNQLESKCALMLSEIDMLIQNEEVMKALIQSCKYNKLQTERDTLSEKCRQMNENTGQSAQQKLQVCRVCGAYLSRLDTDRRLADHFMGKLHLGYVTMRKELDMVKKRLHEQGTDLHTYLPQTRRHHKAVYRGKSYRS
ncbi:Luc7 [Kluyveromyces lactis]|nr:Luc7 [Kluyveromyces lactis]